MSIFPFGFAVLGGIAHWFPVFDIEGGSCDIIHDTWLNAV
jgi:hypothetical protein